MSIIASRACLPTICVPSMLLSNLLRESPVPRGGAHITKNEIVALRRCALWGCCCSVVLQNNQRDPRGRSPVPLAFEDPAIVYAPATNSCLGRPDEGACCGSPPPAAARLQAMCASALSINSDIGFRRVAAGADHGSRREGGLDWLDIRLM